ncbi:hypothetical protein FQZ97_932240 [compost metagenome]
MGNALATGQSLGEFRIHVVRKEIARMTGVNHEIRFGDRAAIGYALRPKLIIFKIDRLFRHDQNSGFAASGVAGVLLD